MFYSNSSGNGKSFRIHNEIQFDAAIKTIFDEFSGQTRSKPDRNNKFVDEISTELKINAFPDYLEFRSEFNAKKKNKHKTQSFVLKYLKRLVYEPNRTRMQGNYFLFIIFSLLYSIFLEKEQIIKSQILIVLVWSTLPATPYGFLLDSNEYFKQNNSV